MSPPTPKAEETPKAAKETTEEPMAPGPEFSRDATHSTYSEVAPDPDKNPPDGPSVEQELGKP